MLSPSEIDALNFRQPYPMEPAVLGAERQSVPALFPEWLGDQSFSITHGSRFNYVVGEMARGIATPAMVISAVNAGCVGFFGSAGLRPEEIEVGFRTIKAGLSPEDVSWGANLIHTPQQPDYEARVVDLFFAHRVRRLSASAYMKLSPDIVRFSASGLSRRPNGDIARQTHVFAKVSRAEIAEQFIKPAPDTLLQDLVAAGKINAKQAALAKLVPVAEDITAEADSGGHTDRRSIGPLYASIRAVRKRVCAAQNWPLDQVRIGLAGGIATPHSAAAAFNMGAAYVLTGSINQATNESGLSDPARQLLTQAGPADVAMAPAADMFEQGIQVQVLKRGTLFAMRGQKLYSFYRAGKSFQTLSPQDQTWMENVLGEPFDQAWAKTRDYIQEVNPLEAERAERDGNKQLALVARRYLFMAAQWAREGDLARRSDYQIWCGPAQGAFNEWAAGTVLEPLENRTVRQIAWNLLEGAAQITRAAQLRACGLEVDEEAFEYTPQVFA
ncbi:MAG: PfaD family polyunsaturated fatty acid/polyketide biosynthesis protein [Pseudomonadota bacterium]